MSDGAERLSAAVRRRPDYAFLLLLLVALFVRMYLAATVRYVFDESDTAIPLAGTISFAPDSLNLPLRARNHPALPAYVIKVSSLLFGISPLGYRMLHILAGLGVVVMVYRLAASALGRAAGFWAAALVAFNEYFLNVSSRATAHAPFLFFATAAIYAFARFLTLERPAYLYAAAASVAIGFYAKEHVALLLPAFFVALLWTGRARWLRSPHVYLGCLLFFVLIGPDLAWNLAGQAGARQASYATQLQRVGGVGLSEYPLAFYFRAPVAAVHRWVTGEAWDDNTSEYAAIDPWLGVLLFGSAIVSLRWAGPEPTRRLLLAVFWAIFGFFTLVRRGNPDGLDPVSWIWVDVTLIPACLLAGMALARTGGRLRALAWTLTAGVLTYGVVTMLRLSTTLRFDA